MPIWMPNVTKRYFILAGEVSRGVYEIVKNCGAKSAERNAAVDGDSGVGCVQSLYCCG